MGINVLIFADGIRPEENWRGLVYIAINAKNVEKVTVVGGDEKLEGLRDKKVKWKGTVQFGEIGENRLIFGLPARYKILKVLNIVSRKTIFLEVVPGKVTKAIGGYKHPNNKFFRKLLTFAKSLLPMNYGLASDFEDAIYLATAFGQDVGCYLPIGLPKSVYIASEFSKDVEARKKAILFVPTHRWAGKSSVIAQWLSDKNFIQKMSNYELLYNNHPEEKDSVVERGVVNTRGMTSSFWGRVDILVTDYSSIAHDFLAAGGRHVINIVADLEEFEENQGKSPLPYGKQFPGKTITTKTEFLDAIERITDFEKGVINLSEYSSLWIDKIVNVGETLK